MTEKELMLSEHLYIADDEELARDHSERKAPDPPDQYSHGRRCQRTDGALPPVIRHVGERFWVEPPFRTDYGCHTYIGEDFYANYDCIFIDVAEIHIGNNVMFGPRVCIFTAGHPIDPVIRNSKFEYGKEVHIGDNVWIGGNTVINPGVTIGNNVVIGSGSVVTKNIPDNVVAAGSPCRVIRAITDADRTYWVQEAAKYHELRKKDRRP